MRFASALLALAVLAAAGQRSDAQDATAPSMVAGGLSASTAPAQAPARARATAPSPVAAAAASSAAAAPPALKYAPTRSFGQWCRDLPHDPTLLVGFIFSLLSAVGFFFIIYTVLFELVMGIPYKKQSYLLGGQSSQNSISAVR